MTSSETWRGRFSPDGDVVGTPAEWNRNFFLNGATPGGIDYWAEEAAPPAPDGLDYAAMSPGLAADLCTCPSAGTLRPEPDCPVDRWRAANPGRRMDP